MNLKEKSDKPTPKEYLTIYFTIWLSWFFVMFFYKVIDLYITNNITVLMFAPTLLFMIVIVLAENIGELLGYLISKIWR